MYVGKPSHTFAKKLRTLIKNKFNAHLNVYYKTTKMISYFQLKCDAPLNYLSMSCVYLLVSVIRHYSMLDILHVMWYKGKQAFKFQLRCKICNQRSHILLS